MIMIMFTIFYQLLWCMSNIYFFDHIYLIVHKLYHYVIQFTNVELTYCVRFLSVYIDNKIFQKKHINCISTKLHTVHFLIYNASHVLNCKSLKVLYFSLFYPHVDYCCEVLGNTYKSNIQYLFLLPRKIMWTKARNDYLTDTNVLFYQDQVFLQKPF